MTAKEQLRAAFKVILKDLFTKLIGKLKYNSTEAIDITVDVLLREVSIRTPLK